MRTIDFLDKRVTGICNELKKLSVKQKFETSDWLIKPGNFLRPEDADADPAPFEPLTAAPCTGTDRTSITGSARM